MVAGRAGKAVLAVRPLNSSDVKVIEGSDGAAYPFWSPDSRWIGFFAEEKLKKVPIEGGRPQTICDAPEPHGGAWGDDASIVFAPSDMGPLHRVRDTGGAPAPLTRLNTAEKEVAHYWPHFLPGGAMLYLARTSQRQANQIYAARLASPHSPTKLLTSNYRAAYAKVPGTAQGRLLYLRDGTLLAHPFDAAALALSGEPKPVAFGVGRWSSPDMPVSRHPPTAYLSIAPAPTKDAASVCLPGTALCWRKQRNRTAISPRVSRTTLRA
jgi:hypothetical protein